MIDLIRYLKTREEGSDLEAAGMISARSYKSLVDLIAFLGAVLRVGFPMMIPYSNAPIFIDS